MGQNMANNSTMEFDRETFVRILKGLESMEIAEEKAFANLLLRFTDEYSNWLGDIAIELKKADPNATQKVWWFFKELITALTLPTSEPEFLGCLKEPGGAK
jgi:hypothetical protein